MYGGMRGPSGHNWDRSHGFVGIRYWIIRIISSGEKTGADIMSTMEDATIGRWRPSPGAVYPILRSMEEEGYLVSKERDNKKYYSLTQKGKDMIGMLGFGNFYGADEGINNIDDVIARINDYMNYLKDNSEKIKGNENYSRKLKELRDSIEKLL